MPEVTIEGWRRHAGPLPCHPCQTQGPKWANCRGPHPAKDRRHSVFRKEACQRRNTIPSPLPMTQDPPTDYLELGTFQLLRKRTSSLLSAPSRRQEKAPGMR
ncbi:hypothetical protein EVAR_93658_1 [Eumeta japonica]|uniref:Uncharacterized protein n=1 Tax=Eumeta variegata TaxID=151549 RepID=A0A4C1TQN6_EUMVA|nr:hypothetical protein EVAR_93658_1 [Eumeta japonica]